MSNKNFIPESYKQAIREFVVKGCSELEQTQNEDFTVMTFYCKKIESFIPPSFCIDCIENRIRRESENG